MNKILALIKTAEVMMKEEPIKKQNIIHILKLAIEALEKE